MKQHHTPAIPAVAAPQFATNRPTRSQEQSRRAAAAIDAYLQARPAAASRR